MIPLYGVITAIRLSPYFDYIKPKDFVEDLLEENAIGLCIDVSKQEVLAEPIKDICKAVNDAGLELIIMRRYQPSDDVDFDEYLGLTNKLCLGNDRHSEWNGDAALAQEYMDDASTKGYEWICPLIHPCIVWDMAAKGELRAALGKTQCFCFTGYILAAYLFADPRLPSHNDYVLTDMNVHEKYGLTIESLREYLEPMNVWTGAGFQAGLDAGSHIYAERLGFKGVFVGCPFSIPENVIVYDKPEQYPEKCGVYAKR